MSWQSGSGKSSLINGILKEDGLAVGSLSCSPWIIVLTCTHRKSVMMMPEKLRSSRNLPQRTTNASFYTIRKVTNRETTECAKSWTNLSRRGARILRGRPPRRSILLSTYRVIIVPVVVVFTKNDLMIAAAKNRIMQENNKERGQELQKHSEQVASKRYNEECLEKFKDITTHPMIDIAGKLTDHALIARTSFSGPAILLIFIFAQSQSPKVWTGSRTSHCGKHVICDFPVTLCCRLGSVQPGFSLDIL